MLTRDDLFTKEDQEMAERYAGTRTCECGALIECLDGGGYTYWVHVKRSRIYWLHAAVPARSTP
jgi:hypothetical protein